MAPKCKGNWASRTWYTSLTKSWSSSTFGLLFTAAAILWPSVWYTAVTAWVGCPKLLTTDCMLASADVNAAFFNTSHVYGFGSLSEFLCGTGS